MVGMGVPVEDMAGGHRERDDEDGRMLIMIGRAIILPAGGSLSIPRHRMAAYALGYRGRQSLTSGT